MYPNRSDAKVEEQSTLIRIVFQLVLAGRLESISTLDRTTQRKHDNNENIYNNIIIDQRN